MLGVDSYSPSQHLHLNTLFPKMKYVVKEEDNKNKEAHQVRVTYHQIYTK